MWNVRLWTLGEASGYGILGRTGFGIRKKKKKKRPAVVDVVNPAGQNCCTVQDHSVLYTCREQASILPEWPFSGLCRGSHQSLPASMASDILGSESERWRAGEEQQGT